MFGPTTPEIFSYHCTFTSPYPQDVEKDSLVAQIAVKFTDLQVRAIKKKSSGGGGGTDRIFFGAPG